MTALPSAATKRLRHAHGRRMAAREIERLTRSHPGLLAFPLRRVGFVEGATPHRRKPAAVVAFAGTLVAPRAA